METRNGGRCRVLCAALLASLTALACGGGGGGYGSAVNRTRPLCPYPKKAVYQGSGSTDDAASFSCQ
jgi:hypothetical protein